MSRVKGAIDLMRKLAEIQQRVTKPVSADEFANAINLAAPQPKGGFLTGDFLTKYTPEEYAKMETFLNKDKTAGYALKRIMGEGGTPTGKELVSVFNVGSTPGIGPKLAAESSVRGATNLDNYSVNDVLPRLYGKAGFEEVGERMAFDPQYAAPGTSQALINAAPDYVTMQMPQQRINDLLRTRFLSPEEYLNYIQTGKIPAAKLKAVQNTLALTTMGGLTAGGTAAVLD